MNRPESSVLRLALIGLGNIAHKHAEVTLAMPGAALVAGVKRDEASGRDFCKKYDIPNYFSSVEALLDWGEFDAAIVCVGHLWTVAISKLILATGRPCLIEKPLGFAASETASVLKIAQTAHTWGMVAVNRRFYSNIRKTEDLLRKAGGLRAIRIEHTEWMHHAASWGLPEEVMRHFFYVNGIHLVDTMCHLAGMPQKTHTIVRPGNDGRHSFDALLQFQNNAVGHYMAQWYAPGRWAMDVFASDLRITFPCFEESQILRTGTAPELLEFDEIDKEFKPGFYRQMETFLNGVRTGLPPPPPACLLAEGVEIMHVMSLLSGSCEK